MSHLSRVKASWRHGGLSELRVRMTFDSHFARRSESHQGRGTVLVIFTNGAGNNLFQYAFARLLAERLFLQLSHEALREFSVGENLKSLNPHLPVKHLRSMGDFQTAESQSQNVNFVIRGYPENYNFFVPHLPKIRTWFNPISRNNSHDLMMHLRLGDRLFSQRNFIPSGPLDPVELEKAINRFSFKRLFISTDVAFWSYLEGKNLKQMKFHTLPRGLVMRDFDAAAVRFNSLFEMLSRYDPVVSVGNSVAQDFDLMRSFDKVLFQTGTLAWWAAALSGAAEVGVYGPWRGKLMDEVNLAETPLPGWFRWGPGHG